MKKKILITILIMLAILCTFSIIDFLKVKENEKPIFSLMQNKINDGGTIEYIGLGYKIIDYHKIEGISGCYKKTHISPVLVLGREPSALLPVGLLRPIYLEYP